jgi:cation transport ATPase
MTEELEKKLGELLGMKKQLEELTTEKRKSDALTTFAEKKKKVKIYFWVWWVFSMIVLLLGVANIFGNNTLEFQLFSLFVALAGYEMSVLIKLWFHTINSRLLILEEMKQFEIRMTALLEKQAARAE